MNFSFNPYKDFINIVGDNGSGKTTIAKNMFASKVPKDKLFVLNSSGQSIWNNMASPDHVLVPSVFNTAYLESVMLKFGSQKIDGSTLVLDDVDNYSPRKSDVFRSVIINARHMNMGIVVTTRDIQALPLMLYRQAKYSFFGTQRSDYAIYYIATFIGMQNALQLKNLPKYVFGVWDSQNYVFEKIKLSV